MTPTCRRGPPAATRSHPPDHLGGGVLCLASLPVVDVVLDQAPPHVLPSLGPLSMLQAWRGVLLLAATPFVLARLPRLFRRHPGPLSVLSAFVAFFALSLTVLAIDTGRIELGDVIAYSQVLYWLIIWMTALLLVDSPIRARFVFTGIGCAGALAAGCLLYAYATSASPAAAYAVHGTRATFGGFDSGKGIAGSLTTSGLLIAWAPGRLGGPRSTLLGSTCLAAGYLTYARAGMLATGAALCWLLFWGACQKARSQTPAWLFRLIVVLSCLAGVYLLLIGTDDLRARWADLSAGNGAGSGRVLLWKAAASLFAEMSWPERCTGIGFAGMRSHMEHRIAQALHTHSDFFDMMVTGGLAGLLCWSLLWASLQRELLQLPRASAPYAIGQAVVLIAFLQSLFTGQFFLPSTMTLYLVSLVCLVATGGREHGDLREPIGRHACLHEGHTIR